MPHPTSAPAPQFSSPADLHTPPGYSHVVVIPQGRLVWTAGQIGMSPDGVMADGWEAQTRQAFANIGRALAAGGADWSRVVKLTYYVVALDELLIVRKVRDEFVDVTQPPTSSLVQVAGLFRPDLLIEIEAVAHVA